MAWSTNLVHSPEEEIYMVMFLTYATVQVFACTKILWNNMDRCTSLVWIASTIANGAIFVATIVNLVENCYDEGNRATPKPLPVLSSWSITIFRIAYPIAAGRRMVALLQRSNPIVRFGLFVPICANMAMSITASSMVVATTVGAPRFNVAIKYKMFTVDNSFTFATDMILNIIFLYCLGDGLSISTLPDILKYFTKPAVFRVMASGIFAIVAIVLNIKIKNPAVPFVIFWHAWTLHAFLEFSYVAVAELVREATSRLSAQPTKKTGSDSVTGRFQIVSTRKASAGIKPPLSTFPSTTV
ncbi:hypothetical protein BC832DRAFT_591655 [Gaertneriomyces semiglobifer]|nr:hypothetical protein BC832DRAFT_591655 [Gaertneriomyces semiglobifer]